MGASDVQGQRDLLVFHNGARAIEAGERQVVHRSRMPNRSDSATAAQTRRMNNLSCMIADAVAEAARTAMWNAIPATTAEDRLAHMRVYHRLE